MQKSTFKNILYAVVVIAVLLLLLEGGARLLEAFVFSPSSQKVERPGWQTVFFGSLFDWHEADPHLLWHFKAGLDNPLITTNSNHFLGPEITHPKPDNTYRVLVLGDSSPVGLGLKSRRQTFSEILRHMLDRHFDSRKNIDVINAAVSGYSSEQVHRLLKKKGWQVDPDLVVVYCGNNDASISGHYSDRELLEGQKLQSLRSVLCRFALYRVMRGVLLPTRKSAGDANSELVVRVSPEDYGENLNAIARQAREHNCPVIFLKAPVPYLWPAGLQFKPFLHMTGEDGQVLLPDQIAEFHGRDIVYCIDSARFKELYGEADIFTREVYKTALNDTIPIDSAIAYYELKAGEEPDNPIWPNNIGASLWKRGDFSRADSAFDKALHLFYRRHKDNSSPTISACLSPFLYNLGINRLSLENSEKPFDVNTLGTGNEFLKMALEADYFSLRIKQPYCTEIDKLPVGSGLAVIDLPEIFRNNGGEGLFIDHCHPTAEGHLLIAKALCDTISKRRW